MSFLLKSLVSILLPVLCIAEPQVVNYAPFSGAIYIVDPYGQALVNGNWCPADAPISCNSLNQPSWCCPSSYTCASPANSGGLVGCCPSGSSCGGVIYGNNINTVTVTVSAEQPTVVVNGQPVTATVAFDPPATTIYQEQYCMTLTMEGKGLPTTKNGDCGTYLIVPYQETNKATLNAVVYGSSASIALILHFVFRRILHLT